MFRVLAVGPSPRHIAIIMDGNRRYARKHGYSDVLRGHADGFERLAQVSLYSVLTSYSFLQKILISTLNLMYVNQMYHILLDA